MFQNEFFVQICFFQYFLSLSPNKLIEIRTLLNTEFPIILIHVIKREEKNGTECRKMFGN